MTGGPDPRGVEFPSLAPPYGPAQRPRTNGLAIGSLVAGLVGIPSCAGCGVTSIVAIVLGLVAMHQIKNTGEPGYGMALAGVIVGAVTIVVFLAFIVVFTALTGGWY